MLSNFRGRPRLSTEKIRNGCHTMYSRNELFTKLSTYPTHCCLCGPMPFRLDERISIEWRKLYYEKESVGKISEKGNYRWRILLVAYRSLGS